MSECFPCDTVERAPRRCPCGKEDCRPDQRDGYACHAKAQKEYRLRQRARRRQEQAGYLAAIATLARKGAE
jgi:hypothetical protein